MLTLFLLAAAAVRTHAADAHGYPAAPPPAASITVLSFAGEAQGEVYLADHPWTAEEVLHLVGAHPTNMFQLILDDHRPMKPEEAVPASASALRVHRLPPQVSPEVAAAFATPSSFCQSMYQGRLTSEQAAALEDALTWHRWDDAGPSVPHAIVAGAILDFRWPNGGRGLLRAGLANPHLRELCDHHAGCIQICEMVLRVLREHGHLTPKAEAVQELLDSGMVGLAADAGFPCRYGAAKEVVECLVRGSGSVDGAPELAKVMLRAGLIRETPDALTAVREELEAHIRRVTYSNADRAALERTVAVLQAAEEAALAAVDAARPA